MKFFDTATVNLKLIKLRRTLVLGSVLLFYWVYRKKKLISDTAIPLEKRFTVQAFDFTIPSVCVKM